MKTLTITGVPEHFNFPWNTLIPTQPLTDFGIQLKWVEESRGSGKMLEALDEGETDVAIVLTESFFKKHESDPSIKILGLFVQSPLIWGIHISPKSSVSELSQILEPKFLISRKGSGSELMARVLADREKWNSARLEFEIVNNLPGALDRMQNHGNEMFLWEKFTTKPHVDSGEMIRIGEVASPWPCFVVIAKEDTIRSHQDALIRLMDLVYQTNSHLSEDPKTSQLIAGNYGLPLEDVLNWISETKWNLNSEISRLEMQDALAKMKNFGILKDLPILENTCVPGFVKIV